MGIHDKKSNAQVAALQKPQQRADRDYVARVQQRAQRLTEAVDNKKLNPTGAKIAERRRQHIEHQMAQLRSEAVQARRLAEHIESLSRPTTQRTWNRTMTESSIFDPEHGQHPKPAMKNKPTAGRGALTFNPLHPSMELPPEQLIRLLGMESKKTRKHMKTRRAAHKQKPQSAVKKEKIQASPEPANSRSAIVEQKPQRSQDPHQSQRLGDEAKTHRSVSQASGGKPADRQKRPEPQQEAQPRHPMEYERSQPAVLDQRSPGWLLPALVIGLVAGAVVSGSLLLFQSSPAGKQSAPAALTSSEPRKQRIPKQQPDIQQVKRELAPGSGATAKPATRTPAPAKTAGVVNDAKWQAAILTEQKRLRSAAERRLSEQLTKIQVSRELADVAAPPANDHAPTAAAALATSAEPFFDQTAVSEPAATGTVSTPNREAAVEIPAAETLPAVIPADGVEPDRNGDQFEESTDLGDSFEADTLSDAAPAVEQDSVVNTEPVVDADTSAALIRSNEPDSVSDVKPADGQDMEAEQSSSSVADESSSSAPGESASF